MKKYKRISLLCSICVLFIISCAKEKETKINTIEDQNELMAHIRFLASDELKGRKPGTEEAKISARYIAEQFRSSGLQSFTNLQGYLQPAVLEIEENSKELNNKLIHAVLCNNVVGYCEGSDSILKKEYILLMAHYDHLGIKRNTSNSDSIYNGARGNDLCS